MPDRILSRASWLAESVDPGGQASVGPPSVVIVPVEWGQLPLTGARGPDKDKAFVFWERLIPAAELWEKPFMGEQESSPRR